ncbi:MAG: hypothetical protein FJ077_00800 [Cyanobacteria bacterium K_DeepCast_35m_m2_023]|nr:hypothetical protein [Cyanobacteria bacterium K_DeepCast_35m_m2_023]
MAGITDRSYSILCGRIATLMGISQSAARRRIDIRAAQTGQRDVAGRIATAEALLSELEASSEDRHGLLSAQLGTVGSDDLYMVED